VADENGRKSDRNSAPSDGQLDSNNVRHRPSEDLARLRDRARLNDVHAETESHWIPCSIQSIGKAASAYVRRVYSVENGESESELAVERIYHKKCHDVQWRETTIETILQLLSPESDFDKAQRFGSIFHFVHSSLTRQSARSPWMSSATIVFFLFVPAIPFLMSIPSSDSADDR
jgi:hypothetical protein